MTPAWMNFHAAGSYVKPLKQCGPCILAIKVHELNVALSCWLCGCPPLHGARKAVISWPVPSAETTLASIES